MVVADIARDSLLRAARVVLRSVVGVAAESDSSDRSCEQGAGSRHRVRDHFGVQHVHHTACRRLVRSYSNAVGQTHALDRVWLGDRSHLIVHRLANADALDDYILLGACRRITQFHAGSADDYRC